MSFELPALLDAALCNSGVAGAYSIRPRSLNFSELRCWFMATIKQQTSLHNNWGGIRKRLGPTDVFGPLESLGGRV